LFYLHKLHQIALWLRKDFKKATEKDIEDIVRKIQMKKWADWTKSGYKIALKVFYRWLEGDSKTGEYPKKVRWIKAGIKKNNNLDPEDLLTREDVEKMIHTATHPRDKAIISVLFESGCRVGEFLPLKIKHVSFERIGVKIIVNGKTGIRKLLLISSLDYLRNWLDNHPERGNPEAFVWITRSTNHRPERLGYRSLTKILKMLAKKAGISKPVNPHWWRKSSASFKARFFTEAHLCQFFGWVQGSEVVDSYVKLSGRDTD
jgi:site-specific recombinase XerD